MDKVKLLNLKNYLKFFYASNPLVARVFIYFLKENKSFEKFGNNLHLGKRPVSAELPSEIINYAFMWATTTEGHSYWKELSNDWGELIRSIKSKL